MMDLRTQLVTVADAFGEHTGRGRKRVSTLAFNQGNRIDDFASGNLSPTVRSFERAMLWFSVNWPAGAAWPMGIDRPVPAEGEAA